jgi:hypothetical protein
MIFSHTIDKAVMHITQAELLVLLGLSYVVLRFFEHVIRKEINDNKKANELIIEQVEN